MKVTEEKDRILIYLEEKYVRDGLLTLKDIQSLRGVLKSIPDRDTILHCDFHEGNVMVQDGELVLIDLDDICTGHPLFDLIFNYMGHVVSAQTRPAQPPEWLCRPF